MKGSNLALIENCAEGQSIAVGARVVGTLTILLISAELACIYS